MTVEQILYYNFVNDDTEVVLHRSEGKRSIANRWYHDDILNFSDCKALEFTWNGDKNRVTICVLEEEEEEKA